ncbi:class I SAM-dependent methyltransferase [Poriferisphaera sp. WC338]|uniref:class I SAM-dependent methyltransferase n=1 Tax=Poriferisphaera sp. WC338 TaxID=3425129 RepID=UPI003D819F87
MSKIKNKRKAGSKSKQKKTKPTLADKADKYNLYQQSVQEPEHEVEFFDSVYEQEFDKKPKTLREDFCGTHAVCCEWVKLGKDRTALGVDYDAECLEWGIANNQSKLKNEQRTRITLLKDDVRTNGKDKYDVLAAQNFSFWIFKTRAEVLEYFKKAHKNLAKKGMMVMDMMGGGECYEAQEDVRDINGFEYVWDQDYYNPINHDASFYIHFRFKDGSEMRKAFEYHWRFWTIPEVCELLEEAGFSKSEVFWEGEDEDGEGDDNWETVDEANPDPSWICYIVAYK